MIIHVQQLPPNKPLLQAIYIDPLSSWGDFLSPYINSICFCFMCVTVLHKKKLKVKNINRKKEERDGMCGEFLFERVKTLFEDEGLYDKVFVSERSKTREHNICERSESFYKTEFENFQKSKKNEENRS